MGGLLGVLGLFVIAQVHDFTSGLVLIGFGVVFMASTSKEYTKQVFDFFLSVLKGLWGMLSPN